MFIVHFISNPVVKCMVAFTHIMLGVTRFLTKINNMTDVKKESNIKGQNKNVAI